MVNRFLFGFQDEDVAVEMGAGIADFADAFIGESVVKEAMQVSGVN